MGDSGGNREMIHGESSLQGAEGVVDPPRAMGSLSDLVGLPTGEKQNEIQYEKSRECVLTYTLLLYSVCSDGGAGGCWGGAASYAEQVRRATRSGCCRASWRG